MFSRNKSWQPTPTAQSTSQLHATQNVPSSTISIEIYKSIIARIISLCITLLRIFNLVFDIKVCGEKGERRTRRSPIKNGQHKSSKTRSRQMPPKPRSNNHQTREHRKAKQDRKQGCNRRNRCNFPYPYHFHSESTCCMNGTCTIIGEDQRASADTTDDDSDISSSDADEPPDPNAYTGRERGGFDGPNVKRGVIEGRVTPHEANGFDVGPD